MIKSIKKYCTILMCVILSSMSLVEAADNLSSTKINIQKLIMKLPPDSNHFNEILLPGEIAETEVIHTILAGPFSLSEELLETEDKIFLFIKGKGILKAGDGNYQIEQESIAFATSIDTITINVVDGDTLHSIIINKNLSKKDLINLKSFPENNREKVYFKKYEDCEAYTEKIKSPNTVSRTVLPNNHVPRVAMGTVETIGPDEVGAHEHPMLDQLFLGLSNNDVMVNADDKSVHFPEYSILHIPIGSSHWVKVEEDKKKYYQWIDFFLTKDGEEWLKTHKQLDDYIEK